jgi:hypothetical protein
MYDKYKVYAISKKDVRYDKMKLIYDTCNELEIPTPSEVNVYMDSKIVTDHGLAEVLDENNIYRPHDSVKHEQPDYPIIQSIIIDLSKLDDDTEYIKLELLEGTLLSSSLLYDKRSKLPESSTYLNINEKKEGC